MIMAQNFKRNPAAFLAAGVRGALLSAGVAALVAGGFTTGVSAEEISRAGATDLAITLGVGARLSPGFEGSGKYLLSPFPIVKLHYLRIPQLTDFGGGPDIGPFISPSFRFISKRDSTDEPILRGLNDVDWAFEAGLKLGYEAEHWRAFVAVRRGFNGHEGIVADLGADVLMRPAPDWNLALGPRLYFADDEYMDTYFQVTGPEAIRSGYRRYNPDAGFYAAGLAGEAVYSMTENVSLHLEAEYKRLVGSAADSPIVRAGNRDQFSVGAGVSYRFNFDLFD